VAESARGLSRPAIQLDYGQFVVRNVRGVLS
jgi:hypothetical protein